MRYLKGLLSVFVLLCMLSVCAHAQSGATVITTAEELAAMEYNGNYILGNDIHLTQPWIPKHFEGTLDGGGHTITGLVINSTSDAGVGMFPFLAGTVSNLHIQNARINANNPSGCMASIIGNPTDAWGFDPMEDTFHIINCHVTGTIYVCGSSGIVGGSALVGAVDSSANVDIYVEGVQFMSPALWGCSNSVAVGTMSVTDHGGDGDIAAIINSVYCEAGVDVTVVCDSPENSGAYTYAIHGRDNVRSVGCINYGTISAPANLRILSNSDGCENQGDIISDDFIGMIGCAGCYLSGEISNAGKLEAASAIFFEDFGGDDGEKSYNESDLTYTFSPYSNTTSLFIKNSVRPGTAIKNRLNINAGAADVSINSYFNKPEGYDKHVYERGDINVQTTSGAITIYRDTATEGSIDCSSDSGDITITAGAYNSGSVKARSNTGYIHAVGGSHYNSGSVSVTAYNGGTAIGVYGEGALNNGAVTASGDSEKDINAIGAGGTNCTNNGPVSASNRGTGDSNATGVAGENCLNTGSVYALNSSIYRPSDDPLQEIQTFSNACGASGRGSFNTGAVTASGSCYCAHAFAVDGGASSNGTVTARGSHIANADGDGGPATANGSQFASASGVSPSASSAHGSLSDRSGHYWYLDSHHSRCIMSHEDHIINSGQRPSFECVAIGGDGKSYVCGRTNYVIAVITTKTGDDGGEQPDASQETMPEEDEFEKRGNVKIRLYGDKNKQYPISEFTYAVGSFSFPVPQSAGGMLDHTKLYMSVVVENETPYASRFALDLSLPSGFSTKPWEVERTRDISCIVNGNDSKEIPLFEVYPLYSASCPQSVKFSVAGDIDGSSTIPVQRIEGEGYVLARATGGVNPNAMNPIPVQITLTTDDLISKNTSTYNENLALLTCAMSQAIYDESFMENSIERLGFTCYVPYRFEDGDDYHKVASAYAMKKVVHNNVVYPVILATVRGTYGYEWIGNFNVGDDMEHWDFANAAYTALFDFDDYCSRVSFPKANSKAIFGAHSRAAAVTNLMAAELNNNERHVENLTAYCYATPNSTKTPQRDANIINIIYVDDLVAYVPQGYYKNGVEFIVGDLKADAPASVAQYYQQYCTRAYMNPRNSGLINTVIMLGEVVNGVTTELQMPIGEMLAQPGGDGGIAQAHGAENYLAWIQGNGIAGGKSYAQIMLERRETAALTRNAILAVLAVKCPNLAPYIGVYAAAKMLYPEPDHLMIGIFCPVDITIRDEDGNIAARFEDHQIAKTSEGCMIAAVADQHHLLSLDAGKNYTFQITGSGAGTMHIEMAIIDKNNNLVDNASFLDIPVEQGGSFTLDTSEGQSGEGWHVVSGSGEIFFPGGQQARIYLPAAMRVLADEAFLGNTSMTGTLVCPDGMTSIGARAFCGSGIDAIVIPASVTQISDEAFEGARAVIHCYAGSPIHDFALEKNLDVVLIQ